MNSKKKILSNLCSNKTLVKQAQNPLREWHHLTQLCFSVQTPSNITYGEEKNTQAEFEILAEFEIGWENFNSFATRSLAITRARVTRACVTCACLSIVGQNGISLRSPSHV